MIKKEQIKLLEENGWMVESDIPLEIKHQDGSVATLGAIKHVISSLETEKGLKEYLEYREEKK